jgi:hypothetical protein
VSASLTSTAGAIIDNLTGDAANVFGDASDALALSLSSATGTGTAAAPLRTSVAKLEALNSTSGGLFVREATALEITGSNLTPGINVGGSSGTISLVLTRGSLTVSEAIQSTATGTNVGNVLLQTLDNNASDGDDGTLSV